MKLGELKTAIRASKGNPKVATKLANGSEVWVAVQKASLLDVLTSTHEHKNIETGMLLDGRGNLGHEVTAIREDVLQQVTFSADSIIDLDDL